MSDLSTDRPKDVNQSLPERASVESEKEPIPCQSSQETTDVSANEPSRRPTKEPEVFKKELEEIEKRQSIVFGDKKADPNDPENSAQESTELVGIALSGGGIRSAMFNRGLLQALSHRGFLRYVDYLCSVSGGGYIAGWLGKRAMSIQEGHDFHAAKDPLGDEEQLAAELGTDPVTGRHASAKGSNPAYGEAYPFQKAGSVFRLWRFLPRYFGYTLPVALLWVSAWAMVATLLALFWRSFDNPYSFRVYFLALGLEDIADELLVAFLPAILMALIWSTLRVSTMLVEERPAVHKFAAALCLILAFFFLGPLILVSFHTLQAPLVDGPVGWPWQYLSTIVQIAGSFLFIFCWSGLALVFLASGAIAWMRACHLIASYREDRTSRTILSYLNKSARVAFWIMVAACIVSVAVYLGNGYTQADPNGEALRLNYLVAYITLAAAVLQLIPLLGRGRLAKSAAETASPLQKSLLDVVGWVCVIVPGFAIVNWMASENISGYATHRGPQLHREDVKDWRGLGKLVPKPNQFAQEQEALNQHKLTFRGIDESSTDWAGPSWRKYDERPFLSVMGTLRAWNLLLGGWDTRGTRLSTYKVEYQSILVNRDSAVDAFNRKMKDFSLTDGLITKLVDLAHEDPGDEQEILSRVTIGPKPTDLSAKVEYTLKDEGTIVDHTAVREFLANRMNLMEDWDSVDRGTFWKAWDQFMALLPTDDPLDSQSVDGLVGNREHGWQPHEIASFNRYLLELLYPDIIRERTMVSSWIVPVEDQKARWKWLLFWLLTMAILALCVDANRDSAFFRYYSERLSDYYLWQKLVKTENNAVKGSLASFDTCARGMPYHLFSASLMTKPGNYGDGFFDPFLFSRNYCGSKKTAYANTNIFPTEKEKISVADAIAISGAAVTPLMTANIALRIVMRVFNFTLGAFIPHPKFVQENLGKQRFSTNFVRTVWSSIKSWWQPNRDWDMSFVADGGFREYLGAEDLLRRKCRLIVVSDAGCNEGSNEFSALAALVRLARMEHGIEFLELDREAPISVDRFRRKNLEDPSPQQFLCARIRYKREDQTQDGLLVYLHMALTGKEDVDLQQFRKQHPKFPYESTSNQFFTPNQIESYRQLGYHIGKLVCHQLPPWLDAPQWKEEPTRRMTIDELIYRIKLSYLEECYLEKSFDDQDATPEVFFDIDESQFQPYPGVDVGEAHVPGSSTQVFDFNNLPVIEDSVETALRRFEEDADFRLKWRAHIYAIYLWIMSQSTRHPEEEKFNMDELPGADRIHAISESASEVALSLLLFNQLVTPPNETSYQVGGRERLISLAKYWSAFWKRREDAGDTVANLQDIARFLGVRVHSVFLEGIEPTVQLYVAKMTHGSIPDPPPEIVKTHKRLAMYSRDGVVYSEKVRD